MEKELRKSCWLVHSRVQIPSPAFSFKKVVRMQIRLGKYRHYKGNEYEILGVAKHSESLEELVAYKALYGEKLSWVRPMKMFKENVVINGVEKPRFEFIA